MKRHLGLTLCAALAAAGPATARASEESDYFRAYQRAIDGMQAGDCKAHLAKGMALTESPHFQSALTRQGQETFVYALIDCAYSERDLDAAFKAAQFWHGFDPKDAWVQAVRMHLGELQGQPEVTVNAFMTLVRIAPDYVAGLELRDIWDAINAAEKLDDSDDRKFEMHQALVRVGYSSPPPMHDGYLRLEHARLLLARGDVASARTRLAGVSDLGILAQLRVDRQFDALRGDKDYEAGLDLTAAAERNVAASRKLMEQQPDQIDLVEDHVSALSAAGRPEEALAAADAAIAKHAADSAAFKDAEDNLRWLLNRRGYILYDLGRTEEARAAMAEAAGLAEHGDPNVSNVINYTLMLVDEGAAKEAAELLPKIGKASPYGQGWIEAARACVGVQLGDLAMQKAGLDWLREHEQDNRSAVARALLCANSLDEAAALFVRRLGDPEARGDALMALQDQDYSHAQHLPVLRLLVERLRAVRERPEVQAAVAAVGRIEKIPVRISAGDI